MTESNEIHAYLSLSNDQAEILHCWSIEGTFGNLQGQTVFAKSLKDTPYLIMMKNEGIAGVNAKVIHIYLEPLFSDHVREDMIHEGLKYGGCIAEAKEHDSGFVETEESDESCLPLVRLLDPNIVISPANVELGEID